MSKSNKIKKRRLMVQFISIFVLVVIFILLYSIYTKEEDSKSPVNYVKNNATIYQEISDGIDRLAQVEKHNEYVSVRDNMWKERDRVLRAEVIEKRRIAREVREKKEQIRINSQRKRSADRSNVASVSRGSGSGSGRQEQGQTFQVSYYTSGCYLCSGISASGVDLRHSIYYQGMRVIATDPRVIPLWSIVEITTSYGTFTAISLDTGGRIKNRVADVLVASEEEAFRLGRHNVRLKVIRRGR